ncbi:MAG: class I SAM-dependent methyltransferase [Candidatus Nealsonbacteria bacterium]|nr:class I SAM-dependent methyltransferase [Candidatus Nealsonbacteria bacterium]
MEFLNPEKVIERLDLKPDMFVADLGSGSGKFSIPLAKRIKDGMVWALDIQKEPLAFLKGRTIKEKIHNINIMRCDLEQPKGSKLNGSFFDLALAVDILFQVKDIDAIISEAARILKSKGSLFVSDRFPEGNVVIGTPPSKILKAARDSGLRIKKELDLGENRYGLIFEKN